MTTPLWRAVGDCDGYSLDLLITIDGSTTPRPVSGFIAGAQSDHQPTRSTHTPVSLPRNAAKSPFWRCSSHPALRLCSKHVRSRSGAYQAVAGREMRPAPRRPHLPFSPFGVPFVCRRSSLAYAPASPRAPLPESFTLSVPCAQGGDVRRKARPRLATTSRCGSSGSEVRPTLAGRCGRRTASCDAS